jgi:hypothetical protein
VQGLVGQLVAAQDDRARTETELRVTTFRLEQAQAELEQWREGSHLAAVEKARLEREKAELEADLAARAAAEDSQRRFLVHTYSEDRKDDPGWIARRRAARTWKRHRQAETEQAEGHG